MDTYTNWICYYSMSTKSIASLLLTSVRVHLDFPLYPQRNRKCLRSVRRLVFYADYFRILEVDNKMYNFQFSLWMLCWFCLFWILHIEYIEFHVAILPHGTIHAIHVRNNLFVLLTLYNLNPNGNSSRLECKWFYFSSTQLIGISKKMRLAQ